MRSTMWTKKVVVQGLLGALVSTAGTLQAAGWYDSIGLSGYAQTSYVGNLNTPKTATGAKASNVGRQFDTESNGFSFNTFLLQIARPVSDNYGFTVRLRTGQDATVYPGSSFGVQEGYLTYAPTSKLSIIGGKFVTPVGYEVVDTIANPNFSEGLLFTYAEPVGHTGVKANYVFNDKVNATLGLVNGWDVAPDNNTAKTVIFQVATAPTKKVGWLVQGIYGKELADPSNSSRLSLDSVVTVAATDKLTLAAQGNWGQQDNDPGVITNGGTAAGTSHWSGAGVWASFAETSKLTTSLRFEVLSDENFGGRFTTTSFARTGTTNQTVKEFTVTQKFMVTPSMGMRGEFRHDWSNQAYFVRNDGSAVRNQNTISADWFVTF